MSDVLKKFGRYFLLDRIAQGGMAEIYRSRFAALDGPTRLLVIKRIQQGFGANQEFLSMFRSEIEVTMGFNHPNIVQVYDFGDENSQPYIAMELVDGRNLRQFLIRFSDLKQTFPIDLAAFIMEQACAGIHYAHTFKDKITGEPLNIIHRDISPQNILISYEGNVKVIDFGIAKAANNSESTRAGIIKGKPSYLSPEQISGEALDGRCDIFALGTVLWELLTGRKLFSGDNDLQVLKMIESAGTHVKAPSTQNPEVPKELDYIVLKALAKPRDLRYQTADEMRRALHRFIYSFNPDFNPGDLSHYAKDLFKKEIVEDRKRIQKLNDRATQLLTAALDGGTQGTMTQTQTQTETDTSAPQTPEQTTSVFQLEPAKPGPAPILTASRRAQDAPKSARIRESHPQDLVLESIQAGSREGSIGPLRREQVVAAPPPAPPPAQAQAAPVNTPNTSNTLTRSGTTTKGHTNPWASRSVPTRGKGLSRLLVVAAILVAVLYFGPTVGLPVPQLSGLLGTNLRSALDSDATSSPRSVASVDHSSVVQNSPPANTAANGLRSSVNRDASQAAPAGFAKNLVSLHLAFYPPLDRSGAQVTLNGKTYLNPDAQIIVPMDESLDLLVERSGYKPVRREFSVSSREVGPTREWTQEVVSEAIRFGYVTIRTTPSADAYITSRDAARTPSSEKPLVRRTPFEGEKFPVGTYQVRLINDVLGMEKIVTLKVEEGRSSTIDERLEIKN